MAIFGNTTVYTSPVIGATPLGNKITVCSFKMGTVGGTGTSIVAYLRFDGANTKKVKAALYDSNKNLVTNGTTNEYTITSNTAGSWITFPFSVAPTLNASVDYYLAVWSESSLANIDLWYNLAGGNGVYETTATYDGWTASLTGLTEVNPAYAYTNSAIYCIYTPSTTPYTPTDTYASGYLTRFQKRQIVGYYKQSGDLRSIEVNASGHVYTDTAISTSGIAVVVQSGVFELISGQWVTAVVDVAQSSGLEIIWRGVRVSGAVIVSGSVNATVVSGAQVITQPIGQISGTVMVSGVNISGEYVTISSGTRIITAQDTPVTLRIHNSGNPLQITDVSGGTNLLSGAVISVTLKSLASNTGDIYIGGHESGNRPYSGQGFCLSKGEGITIDIENMGLVSVCAAMSGNKITYIGNSLTNVAT